MFSASTYQTQIVRVLPLPVQVVAVRPGLALLQLETDKGQVGIKY